jgi:hypothetical protein
MQLMTSINRKTQYFGDYYIIYLYSIKEQHNVYHVEARHPLEARRPGNHLIQPRIPPRFRLSNAEPS